MLANISNQRMSVQLMSAKLPSPLLTMIDFCSRHPIECDTDCCTICQDIDTETQTTFLGSVSASTDPAHLCSPAGWRDIQQTDEDLRRCHALLSAGISLPNRTKKARALKTYLRVCSINSNGLLVVKKTMPFQAKPVELIVIPQAYSTTFTSNSTIPPPPK